MKSRLLISIIVSIMCIMVLVISSCSTPTPTPTPASPKPASTPTTSPAGTTIASPKPTATSSPSPTATAIASPKPTPTSSPSPTATTAAKAEYTIRLQVNNPPGDNAIWGYATKYKELVEKRTNGRVQVLPKGTGGYVTDKEMPDAVRTGLVDSIVWYAGSMSEFFKGAGEFFYLAPFADKPVTWQQITSPIVYNFMNKYLDPSGLVMTSLWSAPPDLGWMTKQNTKFGPNMFQNLRMRATLASFASAGLEALGAKVITISLTDVYTAIQLGTADGLNTGLSSSGWSYKLYEVAPYIWDVGDLQAQYTFDVIFNKKYFNNMPADLQAAVLAAGQDMHTEGRKICLQYSDQVMSQYKVMPTVHYNRATDAELAVLGGILKPFYWKAAEGFMSADMLAESKATLAKLTP